MGQPNFRLSKSLLIGVGALVILFIVGLSTYSYFNNLQEADVQREVQLSRQYESLKTGLDAYLVTAEEQAGVTKAQSAAFDKIMLDAVQGRYVGKDGAPTGVNPKGGALFSAISEAYPNLDKVTSSYNRILDTISSGRTSFANNQQKLQDQLREYDQWRKSGIVQSWFISSVIGAPTSNLVVVNGNRLTGQAAYDVMSHVITSGLTQGAFQSGTLNSQNFFGN